MDQNDGSDLLRQLQGNGNGNLGLSADSVTSSSPQAGQKLNRHDLLGGSNPSSSSTQASPGISMPYTMFTGSRPPGLHTPSPTFQNTLTSPVASPMLGNSSATPPFSTPVSPSPSSPAPSSTFSHQGFSQASPSVSAPTPTTPNWNACASPLGSRSGVEAKKGPGARLHSRAAQVIVNRKRVDPRYRAQLEKRPITHYQSSPNHRYGAQIVANDKFVCYSMKGKKVGKSFVRVMSLTTAARDLIRVESEAITDLLLLPVGEKSYLLTSGKGGDVHVFVVEEDDEKVSHSFAGRLVAAPAVADAVDTPVLIAAATSVAETGFVAVAGGDGVITLFNLHKVINEKSEGNQESHEGTTEWSISVKAEVTSLNFSPSGQYVACADMGGQVHCWRVRDGTLVSKVSPHEGKPLFSVLFVHEDIVMTGSDLNQELAVWRVGEDTGPDDGLSLTSSWVMQQQIRFTISGEEDTSSRKVIPYNRIIMSTEGSAVFIANQKYQYLYILHISPSTSSSASVSSLPMDYITEYDLLDPVLFMHANVDGVEDSLMIFAIQSSAINIFTSHLSDCWASENARDSDVLDGIILQSDFTSVVSLSSDVNIERKEEGDDGKGAKEIVGEGSNTEALETKVDRNSENNEEKMKEQDVGDAISSKKEKTLSLPGQSGSEIEADKESTEGEETPTTAVNDEAEKEVEKKEEEEDDRKEEEEDDQKEEEDEKDAEEKEEEEQKQKEEEKKNENEEEKEKEEEEKDLKEEEEDKKAVDSLESVDERKSAVLSAEEEEEDEIRETDSKDELEANENVSKEENTLGGQQEQIEQRGKEKELSEESSVTIEETNTRLAGSSDYNVQEAEETDETGDAEANVEEVKTSDAPEAVNESAREEEEGRFSIDEVPATVASTVSEQEGVVNEVEESDDHAQSEQEQGGGAEEGEDEEERVEANLEKPDEVSTLDGAVRKDATLSPAAEALSEALSGDDVSNDSQNTVEVAEVAADGPVKDMEDAQEQREEAHQENDGKVTGNQRGRTRTNSKSKKSVSFAKRAIVVEEKELTDKAGARTHSVSPPPARDCLSPPLSPASMGTRAAEGLDSTGEERSTSARAIADALNQRMAEMRRHHAAARKSTMSTANEDLYEKGLEEEKSGNFAGALTLFNEAMKAGNTRARTKLALWALEGRKYGVKQDGKRARKMLLRSAMEGHVRAMYNLGYLLEQGHGVAVSPDQALFWYREAASHGDKIASAKASALFERMVTDSMVKSIQQPSVARPVESEGKARVRLAAEKKTRAAERKAVQQSQALWPKAGESEKDGRVRDGAAPTTASSSSRQDFSPSPSFSPAPSSFPSSSSSSSSPSSKLSSPSTLDDQLERRFAQMEVFMANKVEEICVRMEQERAAKEWEKRKLEDRKRQEAELTLSKKIADAVAQRPLENVRVSVREELRGLESSIVQRIEEKLLSTMQFELQAALHQALGPAMREVIAQSMSEEVVSAVSKATEKACRAPVRDAFKSTFGKVVIPAFEAATQDMFRQMDERFQDGLRERFESSVKTEFQRSSRMLAEQLMNAIQSWITASETAMKSMISDQNKVTSDHLSRVYDLQERNLQEQLEQSRIQLEHLSTTTASSAGAAAAAAISRELSRGGEDGAGSGWGRGSFYGRSGQTSSYTYNPSGLSASSMSLNSSSSSYAYGHGGGSHLRRSTEQQYGVEVALRGALDARDRSAVLSLCCIDFPPSASRDLSPPVLLSLLHQLSSSLEFVNSAVDAERVLQWMTQCAISLSENDHSIGSYVKPLCAHVNEKIQADGKYLERSAPTEYQMLMHILFSKLHGNGN